MTIAEVLTLARAEADKHGFANLPIKTDHSKRHIGGCAHLGPVAMYFTFSDVLMPLLSEAEVLDTIRHEIAHAKTPYDGHGHAWKLAAMAIGAKPVACSAAKIDAKLVGYKYVATCACGPIHGCSRRRKLSVRCIKCLAHLTYVQQY